MSSIILVDTVTGSCEAFLDGAVITRLRTAAASAVATRLLLGGRDGARFHRSGIACEEPPAGDLDGASHHGVLVWSRTVETASAFARYAAAEGVSIEIVATPREVAIGSDILCTLTPSQEPIVLGRLVRPGTPREAAGAPPRPDHREIDSEGISRSRVVVDSFEVASTSPATCAFLSLRASSHGATLRRSWARSSLAEPPRRTDRDGITLYKSVGIPTQDVATARLALTIARKRGVGTEVDLWA